MYLTLELEGKEEIKGMNGGNTMTRRLDNLLSSKDNHNQYSKAGWKGRRLWLDSAVLKLVILEL